MKKIRQMANRIFSLFLVLVMVGTMTDMTAFAQAADTSAPQAQAELSTGDTIFFGSYPQSEVTGTALTDAVVNASYDSNGDAEAGGERYRRIKVTGYVTKAEYEKYCEEKGYECVEPCEIYKTLEEIENIKRDKEGTYRYFKWEPVKWKVLKNEAETGTLFVMADTALDAVDYSDEPYDYGYEDKLNVLSWKDSALRKWMNTDNTGFCHMAFSNAEQAAVKVNAENPEGDFVYLLSDEEAKNADYGFGNTDGASDSRMMKASAYAQARGGAVYSRADYRCCWYLRTPGSSTYVKNVAFNGAIYSDKSKYKSEYLFNPNDYANWYERTFNGCVPVMHIDASYVAPEPDPTPTPDPTPEPDPTPTPEPTPTGDGSSSDKSVLKSLNFDVPADSAYRQDELQTGTKSMGTMSEVAVTTAGEPDPKTWIYDNDKHEGIRDKVDLIAYSSASYCAGDSINPYTITEAIDADGDGKKELFVQLYLDGTKRGQDILMTLSDIRTQKTLFKAQPTGGYISTTDDIPPWAIEGLLSMCTGDFDGDGCEELAVYTPNNKEETVDGSIANTQQIKIYKLGSAPTKLSEPQQVIDIAKVGDAREDCQEWLYSHVGNKKQYYSLPYMELASGDMDKDGIDDLLTVANFSSTFRGTDIKQTVTWGQLIDPDTCLGSVLDVYKGRKTDSLEQVVKKRVLVGRDTNGSSYWNNGAGVLRNASVTIANVTGANSNEIVFAGNYTGIEYNDSITENTTVTKSRYVFIKDEKGDTPRLLVGYVTTQGLLSDSSKAASLSYNWTMQEEGYAPLHYYNGYKNSLDPGNEPVEVDGFAAYGSEQPDTIAVEGQMFAYNADDNKLKCDSYVTPSSVGSDKSNVWISAQTVGNVTNDPFGRETLYYVIGKKKSGKETYWNDRISVWGVVNENGAKSYQGTCMAGVYSSSAMHYSFAMCDIDDDSSFIKYEAGNTDVYYSNVQLLSVLQAPPVYGDLGDDYVSGAETSYGKSSGSSVGTGQSYQVSAGVIAGFEHETSLFGLVKLFSMEVTAELSASVGWEYEKTAEKEFTTTYNTDGTEDVAVLYTVPYVRYNGQIYVPTYTLPTRAEYDAKKAFFEEFQKNIERYQDIKAGVTGGTYAKPADGYNNDYTTNVTSENYDYQLRTLKSYAEWLQQTESQMEGFEGSAGLAWGAEIEGGWEDYFFCVPQTPIITSVTADTYNEIAAGCKDLQPLYGTALPKGYVAGRPETYASNAGELAASTTVDEKSIETGKTNAGSSGDLGDGFISSTAISASSSAPSQTIAFTEENAKTNSVGIGVSLEMVATAGGVKGGVSLGFDSEASWSSSTTKGCEFSGQVPNLPQRPDYMTKEQYGNYDYAWKLVAYKAKINGSNVPVVGYYTKYADRNKIPPYSPSNLELEDVKSDSITLTWNGGSRAADHYNVYQVSGKGANKAYVKVGTVSGNEEGTYRFTHENLQKEQSYTYVVASCNEDETAFSVYTDELTTTTPAPEFDVTIKLDGMDSGQTYLAGKEQTLTANLVTQNYPQSEIDQYIWQVNDGNGWKKLPDAADQDSYTWTALAKSDGYQYRCGAYVAVESRLYRLYSEPVMLHVRKAAVQVTISADKKEGAADTSSEFGLAEYNGDVLELTANVISNDMSEKSGRVVFVITGLEEDSGAKEYSADVSADGTAQAQCRFEKAGRYIISARYVENEIAEQAESGNTLPYYAYPGSEKEERANGQNMENTINDLVGDDLTVDNAIAKKTEILVIKQNYESMTDSQKNFVETTAKEKLEGAMDTLEAAEAVEKINGIGTITKENAAQKKTLIDDAKKAYDVLTDAQKALVPDAVKNVLEAAQEAYEQATGDDNTPTASLSLNKTKVTLYTGKASKSVTVKPTVTGKSKTVTWKTNKPKVAVVKKGVINAVGKGTATITATANGISKTVKVTVKNPTITIKKGSKKFTKSGLTVKKNKKEVLTVTVNPKNSGISIAKLTAKQKKIASVTLKKGKITIKGKKKGTFTLQIKSGKTTKKIKITVK
ncbi:MAG: fibronectin type III domain-containing protein [Lachnospiraceae bacterium]|nr:fibronectin type III domain-containing protein [Lachnospiraceae bacterium]